MAREPPYGASEGPKIMSYIIKADVSGSAEAVAASIEGLGNSEVSATVLYKGVGPVNDTDLARAARLPKPRF